MKNLTLNVNELSQLQFMELSFEEIENICFDTKLIFCYLEYRNSFECNMLINRYITLINNECMDCEISMDEYINDITYQYNHNLL